MIQALVMVQVQTQLSVSQRAVRGPGPWSRRVWSRLIVAAVAGLTLAGAGASLAVRAEEPPAASPEQPVAEQPATGPKVPQQPTDPAAAKVYGVFDQACAGCHQRGRIKDLLQPAGMLGNILDLEALARNVALVQPGNPDASPLYNALQSRAMPLAAHGATAATVLTATELGAVRDWIEQLPSRSACDGQNGLTAAAVGAMIGKVVQGRDAAQVRHTRFISLVPLHNACATAETLEAARQAIAWMVNSVSLGLEPVKLSAADADGLLLEVDLAAIGWEAARWDRLALRAPSAFIIDAGAETNAALGTRHPVINGDWLIDAAGQAPLYYELLGTPETLASLFTGLRIDLSNTSPGAANRIGLKSSVVARGNRLLERRAFANGTAWIASEFAPTAGRPDLFQMAIAAATAKPVEGIGGGDPSPQLRADATLVHFDLPNGFPAFFIANAAGARVNDVPQSILRDESHPTTRIAVAQGCTGCHGASPVALSGDRADEMRARVEADNSLTKEQRDKILALHSDPTDLQRKIDEDRTRFQRVMAATGIDTTRELDGLDLLPAMAARYRRSVTLGEVADLAGLEPKALLALGPSASPAAAAAMARLAFGPIPRADVDAVLPDISIKRGLRPAASTEPAAANPADGAAVGPLDLVVTAERPVYQSGDLLTVTVRANDSCYLTLLTLDTRGRATVLYPNEFDANNLIEAARDIRIPGDKAPYQLRLREKGHETVIGICSSSARPPDGIRHNFEFQRFTELGDYRAFLNRNWDAWQLSEKPASGKTTSGRHSDSGAKSDPIKPDPVKTGDTRPETQARSAIRLTIE